MPVTLTSPRDATNIEVPPDFLDNNDGRILIRGADARLKIGAGCRAGRAIDLSLGPGAVLEIGENCRLGYLLVHIATDATIRIGRNTTFNGAVRLYAHESAGIDIAENCLVASEVTMMASDMHAILDCQTNQRLNPAKPIHIGSHVWIGSHATILKGATIGPDSVIALGSIVGALNAPANSLIAGTPARITRSGITWRNTL